MSSSCWAEHSISLKCICLNPQESLHIFSVWLYARKWIESAVLGTGLQLLEEPCHSGDGVAPTQGRHGFHRGPLGGEARDRRNRCVDVTGVWTQTRPGL